MKKWLLLNLCTLIFAVAVKAQTPSPKEMVEKKWVGLSEQSANFTKSGKIQLSQSISLTLNSDNSVTGTGITKMTLDGISYSCTASISGTFYPATWSVYIKDENQYIKDKLPMDLKWCKGWGTLTFYRNKTHPGYYLMKGSVTDDCGGRSDVEFSDYPYSYK